MEELSPTCRLELVVIRMSLTSRTGSAETEARTRRRMLEDMIVVD